MRDAFLSRMFEAARGGVTLTDGWASQPFEAVLREGLGLGAGLRGAWGDLRGVPVLLAAPAGIAWVRGFFALWCEGAHVVPLPREVPAPEIEHLAREAGGATRALVAPGATPPLPIGTSVLATTISPGGEAGERDVDEARAAHAALVLATSGTTGRPKAVPLVGAQLAVQARVLAEAWGIGAHDTLLHVLPLHHVHGIVVALLTALGAGASVRLFERFEAGAVLDRVGEGTVLMTVPTMLQRLVEAIDRAPAERRDGWTVGLRALRLTTSGSAALPVTLATRWSELTGAVPLERYGMTEIGIALSNPLEPAGRRVGAVGQPLPTVEACIVDDAGAPCEGPGELWVRGPSVFAGYVGRSEETRASFEGDWFKTGDVAVREQGAIRLLGRASVDILKTGGEKVSALEIEEVLREHPAVHEVAVVGVPDVAWGDRVVAVVVLREATPPEALRAFCKERLSPFKVPKDFVMVSELPRNAMGKVVKAAVRALVPG